MCRFGSFSFLFTSKPPADYWTDTSSMGTMQQLLPPADNEYLGDYWTDSSSNVDVDDEESL